MLNNTASSLVIVAPKIHRVNIGFYFNSSFTATEYVLNFSKVVKVSNSELVPVVLLMSSN